MKKADCNTKINEIEKKITNHYNFTARLKQANLASKSGIANFVKKTDFDNKIKYVTSDKNGLNKLSKKVKAILTKRLTKDLINRFSILNAGKCFSSGTFHNYLVFTPAKKYIKYFSGTTRIESWKSNEMFEESIENITKSDSNFAPTFVDHRLLPDMNFNGHCLIKSNISISKKVINLYISYTLAPQLKKLSTYFTLGNCLSGSVKLTKNADPDKYKCTGYGIGFDTRSQFLFANGSYGKNVDNKEKYILIPGEGLRQGLDDTTLTAEAKYPINFTQSEKRFVLSLHYNGSNSFLLVNATKVY